MAVILAKSRPRPNPKFHGPHLISAEVMASDAQRIRIGAWHPAGHLF
jgi:hypothetical protein